MGVLFNVNSLFHLYCIFIEINVIIHIIQHFTVNTNLHKTQDNSRNHSIHWKWIMTLTTTMFNCFSYLVNISTMFYTWNSLLNPTSKDRKLKFDVYHYKQVSWNLQMEIPLYVTFFKRSGSTFLVKQLKLLFIVRCTWQLMDWEICTDQRLLCFLLITIIV